MHTVQRRGYLRLFVKNFYIKLKCDFQKFFLECSDQSIPAAPIPPPPGVGIFFALDGKFPGVGTLELANAPSSVNTATFFIDRTVA